MDSTGASTVVGWMEWRADFGGEILTSAGNKDIFVVKSAADGSHLWSQRYGSTQDDRGRAVAVDGAGNIYVTGLFRGTINFGGGNLTTPPSTSNPFLVKFSPAGVHLWSIRVASGISEGTALAVDAGGNVIFGGSFYTPCDFGGGVVTPAGGGDIVLVKYSPTGAYLWSRQMGGAVDDFVMGLAADQTTGEIVATGNFNGTANFGGGGLTSAGLNDVFLAKYSPSGSHVWSRRWGGSADDKGLGIAVDRQGNVGVTGVFRGNVDFGGGELSNPGGADIFMVKYSGTGGHIWSRNFGTSQLVDVTGNGIAFDTTGNIFLTGTLGGVVDFGGGPLSGDGWANPFIAKFAPDALHIWSRRYVSMSSPAGHANGRAIASDGTNVLAAGDFVASINFGGSTLASPGGTDTYVAKLGP